MNPVTVVLQRLHDGDPQAAEELLPLVYEELRRLAAHRLSHEPGGQTLQPTALVHEAYVRLVECDDAAAAWNSRGHFFGAAAEAMRRILVESARRKQRSKHGGKRRRIPLEAAHAAADDRLEELLLINDALDVLAQSDPDAAELVKLRYFAGLSQAEAAAALGLAPRTADRTWAYAKAWLHQELAR